MPLDQAELHRLVEACLRDRMRAKPYATEPRLIRRCLGLEPALPRTDLRVQRHESSDGEGWVRQQIGFESQPGVELVALTYRPVSPGPYPLVVVGADAWAEGRRAGCVQALGIALALHGFATVAIDPPGAGDREPMGDAFSLPLSSAIPALGFYVWDLIRAVDLAVSELGALGERVGLVGVGFGGDAALLASAVEERFAAVAVIGAGHSQEPSLDDGFMSLPGIAEIGDWANVLAHRAPMPLLFLSPSEDAPDRVEETVKKLRGSYKNKAHAGHLKQEGFLGGRDLNRRMRESIAGFMAEHLRGEPARLYLTEPLPLTDGFALPRIANTEDPELLRMSCSSKTFEELTTEALDRPYPEVQPDLVPWGKYGRLEPLPEMETLRLVDHGASPHVLALPKVDPASLVPLGLSVADFYAQMLHLLLPGCPEGWEPLALQGDALTAMIASVRTLMKKTEPKAEPQRVEAEGPISSQTARELKRLRPGLEITVTHEATSWKDCQAQGILIPGARYRMWPWPAPAPALPEDPAPGDEVDDSNVVAEAVIWTADDESAEAPDVTEALHKPSGEEPLP